MGMVNEVVDHDKIEEVAPVGATPLTLNHLWRLEC